MCVCVRAHFFLDPAINFPCYGSDSEWNHCQPWWIPPSFWNGLRVATKLQEHLCATHATSPSLLPHANLHPKGSPWRLSPLDNISLPFGRCMTSAIKVPCCQKRPFQTHSSMREDDDEGVFGAYCTAALRSMCPPTKDATDTYD